VYPLQPVPAATALCRSEQLPCKLLDGSNPSNCRLVCQSCMYARQASGGVATAFLVHL
jgi:hypothetical protein